MLVIRLLYRALKDGAANESASCVLFVMSLLAYKYTSADKPVNASAEMLVIELLNRNLEMIVGTNE